MYDFHLQLPKLICDSKKLELGKKNYITNSTDIFHLSLMENSPFKSCNRIFQLSISSQIWLPLNPRKHRYLMIARYFNFKIFTILFGNLFKNFIPTLWFDVLK